MKFLDSLNAQQRAAVTAGEGPVMIVAGPGTGKTKTLSARIGYLLAGGRARSEEILALTFTNKAAREMQARVAALLEGGHAPKIATFHSLCHGILGRSQDRERDVISEAARLSLIRELKATAGLKGLTVRELALAISKAKNSPAVISDVSLGELVERYNQALETRGLYDYDDLLQQTHQLLTHGEALRADLQGRYRYLLVDEFQDTNELQYELVKLLNATGNVLVIGDPLQSIYGFRGASAVVFDRFRSDFPSCRSITLATNYRSTPEVVALAGAVFTDGPQLTAHNRKPGRVAAVEVLNEYSEANWIVGEIERSIGGSDLLRSHQHGGSAGGRTFGDFAVLYRTHAAARPLQAALAKSGIPYQVVGEGSPYQQPAVMAVVEGLRYLAGITPAYNHQLLLEPLRGQADTLPLSQLAQAVATQCGFMAGDDETHRPIVAQFINSLVRFDTSGLAVYLDRLASIAEQEFYDSSAGAVTLLTIHAAKGLEFTRVFLIAAEEGRLPYERPGSTANVDEERRLFYVAVTRAREELDILHARMRVGEAAKVSRFVSDLPAAVLPHLVDDQLITDIRRTEKRRQKRAQGRLF